MANPILTNHNIKADFLKGFIPVSPNGKSSEVRAHARRVLETIDFPTTRQEDWKYTSISKLTKRAYHPGSLNPSVKPGSFSIPDWQGDLLVFVNGVFNPALSNRTFNGDSMQLKAISELSPEEKTTFYQYFGQLTQPEENIFTALNTAYVLEGVFMHIPDKTVLEHPIQILHINTLNDLNLGIQTRNQVVIGKQSKAEVIERFVSVGEGVSLRNTVTEIFVAENSNLEWVKVQSETSSSSHLETVKIQQKNDSVCKHFTLSFSGEIVRNNLNFLLDGKNCESHLYGLQMLDNNQHVDNQTQVDHIQPHSFSNELYKGVLDGKSKSIFSGLIHVHQPAQKTNAFQSNRNLLLSDDANAYSKPQLEIYADDVKCSHGSTTGQLDEEALFYLRARGINEAQARRLLLQAFAGEVISPISNDAVRDYLTDMIINRFKS